MLGDSLCFFFPKILLTIFLKFKYSLNAFELGECKITKLEKVSNIRREVFEIVGNTFDRRLSFGVNTLESALVDIVGQFASCLQGSIRGGGGRHHLSYRSWWMVYNKLHACCQWVGVWCRDLDRRKWLIVLSDLTKLPSVLINVDSVGWGIQLTMKSSKLSMLYVEKRFWFSLDVICCWEALIKLFLTLWVGGR